MNNINSNIETEIDKQNGFTLKDKILRLIWRESQISRAEIARQLNLSRSTVTEIIKELLPTGLLAEVGSGESSGGRKPIVLEFQDEAKVILGIDIGASHVSVAMTDLRGNLLFWNEKDFPAREDASGTYKIIDQLCNECLASQKYGYDKLLSIGVAVPSPVDPFHPEYLSETIIPAWHGKSGLERLREKYQVPVYLDNDANLGALAENWWTTTKDVNDLIYIKLSSGIGAGFVFGGKLYRGAKGIAGEMSHMPIDPNGKLCGCGLRGCLATVLSIWALKARIASLSELYPESPLHIGDSGILEIENAALADDPLALQIVNEATEYLTTAIVSLVNMMNPEMIIIGGSFARLGDILLDPIRKTINDTALVSTIPKTRLKVSELGSKGIAIGAATLAIEQAFIEPELLTRSSAPAVLK
ncbi:MAG: transcriptional regulator [Melioribacteraceae bacterium]|nr:MAG: transcriptional regulator [Melioribacteraceae bacterium]